MDREPIRYFEQIIKEALRSFLRVFILTHTSLFFSVHPIEKSFSFVSNIQVVFFLKTLIHSS